MVSVGIWNGQLPKFEYVAAVVRIYRSDNLRAGVSVLAQTDGNGVLVRLCTGVRMWSALSNWLAPWFKTIIVQSCIANYRATYRIEVLRRAEQLVGHKFVLSTGIHHFARQ